MNGLKILANNKLYILRRCTKWTVVLEAAIDC